MQLIFYSRVAHPGLKLSRDVKGGTKCFCKSISGKKGNVKEESVQLNMARDLEMKDTKKAKVPRTFFLN